jgi:hypothetical protein
MSVDSIVFLEMTQCSQNFTLCFGGIYCVHLQDKIGNQSNKKHFVPYLILLISRLILQLLRCKDYVSQKCARTGLHGVISQKTVKSKTDEVVPMLN